MLGPYWRRYDPPRDGRSGERPLRNARREFRGATSTSTRPVSDGDRGRRIRRRDPRRPWNPYRRINGIAETVHADLAVVSSRGQSPLENRIIGSTARNLARTTVVPLLVNRVERGTDDPDVLREHLFQRVLFATDFSENANRAFDAFSYLRHATEEATLVHVRSPKDEGADADGGPRERLAERASTLENWGIETRIEVRQGDPANEILAVEAEVTPSTVLVGSKGRSRIRRLLLGSVSEEIVAQATGNVFLVPPPRAV